MNTHQSILIVVTGTNKTTAGEATGLWLEEFAVPYLEFKRQGYHVVVATIKGGAAPVDPRSLPNVGQQDTWREAIEALAKTVSLASVKTEDFAAVFVPGGHGTMFDFPQSDDLHRILRDFSEQNKVIAAMCHGPASLVGVTLADGMPLVAGKTVTSFTNEEETAAGFTEKMPFLLESRLRELGATFVGKPNWSDHVQVDDKLITGQNPQSSLSAAQAVIAALANS
jgi:putative intracellular protease/amidase